MLTLQNYFNSLQYLILIGCEMSYNDIFLITEEREIMETNYRRVSCAFVLSSSGIDKSWILNSFLENNSEQKELVTIR